MASFEEPFYNELSINLEGLRRSGRRFTVVGADAFNIDKEVVLAGGESSTIGTILGNVRNVLDRFRCTYRFNGMSKSPLEATFINLYPTKEYTKPWANFSPRGFEENFPSYIDKPSKENYGQAIFLKGLITKEYGEGKFNNLHSIAKLAQACEVVDKLGKDGDEVIDFLFIYTEDGCETFDEFKKAGGGNVDWKKYPDYWGLYGALRYAEVLGYKVFNLGRENIAKQLEDYLTANYNAGASAEWVVDETKRATPLPPFFKGKGGNTNNQAQAQAQTNSSAVTGMTESSTPALPTTAIEVPNTGGVEIGSDIAF